MTKKINNDLRNTTQKTKDRAARIPLKTGGDPMLFSVLECWTLVQITAGKNQTSHLITTHV